MPYEKRDDDSMVKDKPDQGPGPNKNPALADLMARCDLNQKPPADMKAWMNARPAGRES